ncbi:MAG: hypothetical protein AB1704_22030 [Pseudomonadota bacterium]|uniref:hypothetical protein n=1 Tax=Burkholderiaceae TaxID=119060 RepID=UPI0010F6AE35|nr:hypothetical protein [Burkholderia sp. 4M9327F10]
MSYQRRLNEGAVTAPTPDKSGSLSLAEGIKSFQAVAGAEPDLWTLFITLDERGSTTACENLYRFVTHALLYYDYEQLIFSCPDGHPLWLTYFFRKLKGYGLRAEVTPQPNNPHLVRAIMGAVHTRSETSTQH